MMRIGIDFDNTIVSYDTLFHKVAVEQGAVPGRLHAEDFSHHHPYNAPWRQP